jgi:YtkA-like
MKFLPSASATLRSWCPFLLLAAGCSGASAPAPALPLSVTSDSGSLLVELTATSEPTVGTNTIEMTVTGASDGQPRDGVSIAVVPWMPAMGHGTASATVTAEGGGKYRLTEVYLFMPGTWELEISFSGAVSDHADPTFQVR